MQGLDTYAVELHCRNRWNNHCRAVDMGADKSMGLEPKKVDRGPLGFPLTQADRGKGLVQAVGVAQDSKGGHAQYRHGERVDPATSLSSEAFVGIVTGLRLVS